MTHTLATLANMDIAKRIHGGRREVVAISLRTGEEYSADPADYFMQDAKWVMTDEDGFSMHLVVRITHTYDACSDYFDDGDEED